jgi:hypothetical protein
MHKFDGSTTHTRQAPWQSDRAAKGRRPCSTGEPGKGHRDKACWSLELSRSISLTHSSGPPTRHRARTAGRWHPGCCRTLRLSYASIPEHAPECAADSTARSSRRVTAATRSLYCKLSTGRGQRMAREQERPSGEPAAESSASSGISACRPRPADLRRVRGSGYYRDEQLGTGGDQENNHSGDGCIYSARRLSCSSSSLTIRRLCLPVPL